MNAVKVRELQEGAPLAANCGHLPSEKPSRTDAPTLAAPCGHPSRTDAATLAAQDAATGTLIKPPFEKTPLTPHGEVVANAPTKASKKPDGISKAECIGAFIQFSELAQRIGLPIPATMTPGREKSIRSRLRDHGAASWSTALAAIEASDFLRGRTEKADFKISLDWLISPKNFPKVIEGNYGPKIAVSTSETHWTQDPAKVAAVTPDQWRGSIAKYANGTWPVDKLGYWPGHRNCIVPAQIVRELRLLDKYDEVCGIAKGEWKLKQDEAHA